MAGDPLNNHGKCVFMHSIKCKKSWFMLIMKLCLYYKLPHPLTLLDKPLTKERFKSLAKCKVMEYWHARLSSDVKSLPSLSHFNPSTLFQRIVTIPSLHSGPPVARAYNCLVTAAGQRLLPTQFSDLTNGFLAYSDHLV